MLSKPSAVISRAIDEALAGWPPAPLGTPASDEVSVVGAWSL
jgi:hypothetical protein